MSDFFPDPDIFGEGMPPDPIEELFGPWGPGGPFGVPPEDPFGPTGFDPPWGWGPEGPVYNPPPEPPTGWGPEGPYWDPPPVEPPPAGGGAGAIVIDAAFYAAIAVLVIEVVSIGRAMWSIHGKNELNKAADHLNDIHDKAVKAGQWNDELQKAWTKASQELSERAEALQKELDESWIMRLGQWIY